jgi:translocation and assembly module TamB
VRWGKASADLVIQGGYIDISNSRIGDTSEQFIIADGRYALGFRNDGAEEIRARVRMTNWPIVDLRHAFLLDDWPMDGTMGDLDLDLSGQYRNMFGKGRMRIDDGRAWDESFEVATADLELEGTGMRVSRIEMHKGPGRMLGAARIGWDGTYVFNADGEGVPVELLDNFKVEGAPLSGRLRFKVSGAGEFETPTYTFEASIDDLFVGDEGIGAVSGRVAIAGDVMTIERLVAASSRLQMLGTGTIRFDDAYSSDLRIRFQDTALDPYLKFVLTDDVSPYTRVVVGGSLAVTGPLASPVDLTVDTVIDDATVTLYDYDLRNDGPLQMRFDQGRLSLVAFDLAGSNTNLELTGSLDARARTLNLSAAGDASLSILQLFFEGITSAGAARLNASLEGAFDAPRLTGDASISEGRFRPFGSPHSLEAINGRIRFASTAINLEDVTARIGSGDVVFGGTIALDGYQLSDYNLTATGRSMRLRYPAGFNSTVDMRLFLTGPRAAPLLTGTIDVLRVALVGASQSSGSLLGFATAGTAGVPPAAATAPVTSSGIPLALDIQVTAPRMRVIDNNDARIEASADLQVRGTFDVPVIEGAVEIAGGEVLFNGNRYFVREGSVDFNPGEPDPVFNLAAETRPRVSGQIFTVNVGISGTFDRIEFTTSSDPWLPESDVISLLFGGTPALGTAEERSLRSSQELQQQMLQTAGAALLASPLTSRVGAAFERTGAFDTVQITPVLTSEEAFQQLNPTARVTFGKRVSPRVFLTYSRTIGGLEEEIILLEYDQSDRMSWVLSRNEDRTFALDFRIRYVF